VPNQAFVVESLDRVVKFSDQILLFQDIIADAHIFNGHEHKHVRVVQVEPDEVKEGDVGEGVL